MHGADGAASAPGLGSPLPRLHRDWAHPCHICIGTGLTPATSASGRGSPLPNLRQDGAHPSRTAPGPGRGAVRAAAAGWRSRSSTRSGGKSATRWKSSGPRRRCGSPEPSWQSTTTSAKSRIPSAAPAPPASGGARAIGTVLCGLQRVAAVHCNAWSESGRIAA